MQKDFHSGGRPAGRQGRPVPGGLHGPVKWLPRMCAAICVRGYSSMNDKNSRMAGVRGLAVHLFLVVAACMGRWALPDCTLTTVLLPGTGLANSQSVLINMDLIYAPVFIFSLAWILPCLPEVIRKILREIGRESLLMWFVSSIFFGNARAFFQPILYAPKNPILVLLWGLFLCWLVSWAMDLLIRPLQRAKNRLFQRDMGSGHAGGREGG